jgi:uncharacterized glyoxalase superfamily protein PhnB
MEDHVLTTPPTPGHNSVNPFIIVRGSASEFITFLEKVFHAAERREVHTPDRDGTLIHAEVAIGNATIMVADAKQDWPFTPAFTQVYVSDAQAVLDRALSFGAEMVTRVSPFYGMKLARFRDPWGNLWWLFQPEEGAAPATTADTADTSWHDADPSYVYTSLMTAMASPRPEHDR